MGRSARSVVAVVIVGLTLAAAACSDAEPSGPAKVALLVANRQLNFSKEMAGGFAFGVRQVGGVQQEVTGPDIVDGPRELRLFQQLTRDTPDGISVFTLHPELFAQPMREAGRSGIPLLALDNPPLDTSSVTTFIGNDNRELGRMLADLVIQRLPTNATGSIVIGNTTPGAVVLDQRAAGMRDELQARLPQVTVLGPFDTKQEVAANLEAWQTLVRANPDALAFLGTGDADAWHLADIRRDTRGTWLAAAFDLEPQTLDGVKRGDLLLVSPEHFLKGAVAGRLLAAQAKSGTALPQGWIYTPGLAVTPANIDKVIARQASPSTKEAWFADEIDQILRDLPGHLRPIESAG